MLTALANNDSARLSSLIDQTFALLSLERGIVEVVAPVLERIGQGWDTGAISIAQEHLLTSKLRARLEQLVGDTRGGVRGTAVLACAPGERHDLGLLMLAVLLGADGWHVEYLGADTPRRPDPRLRGQARRGRDLHQHRPGRERRPPPVGARGRRAGGGHPDRRRRTRRGRRATQIGWTPCTSTTVSPRRRRPSAASRGELGALGRRRGSGRDRLGAAGAARPRRLPQRLLGRRRPRQVRDARAALAAPPASPCTPRTGPSFGLAYELATRRTCWDRRRLAVGMALAEHAALYPLSGLVDRYHPARGEPGVPPILRSPRAFGQATWRHYLFGRLLGALA